jgi:3-hydroxyacyl-CoA dehydrogenase
MSDIQTVAVLGIGTLGSQIAFHAAFRGRHVTAYDVDETALVASRQRLAALPAAYVRDAVAGATPSSTADALASIRITTDLAEAVRDADLVIEAAPEILAVKRELHHAVSRLARADAIITTNSSYMLPSDLADVVHLPGRFLALHFANHIWRYNTAEIMPSPSTDAAAVEAARRYAADTGMLPVVMTKEKSGYVLNTMLAPFMRAAAELLVGGYADVETVDATWRTATGSPYGPFQIYDVIGLRNSAATARMSEDPKVRAWAEYLHENYVKHGKTGVESGEGFYRYPSA